MYDPAVLRFALISGLIGFSSFCVSYAVLVWRKRNLGSVTHGTARMVTLRRWASCFALAGILTIAIAVAVREVNRADGVLSSDGLYAIRAPDDAYRVTYLADSGSVKQGDLVARLECPEAEAKIEELELQCQQLEKEREALQLDSLTLDNELVRHHQNGINAANQLRSSIGQLLPEHESMIRQAVVERLARLEKVAQINVDIAWTEGQLVKAVAHHKYVSRDLERVNQLAEQNAVAQSEIDSISEQADDAAAEIANLKQRMAGLTKQKTLIEKNLAQVSTLASSQEELLGNELRRARTDFAATESRNADWAARLAEDVARASCLQQRELEQLALKIQQCHAQLEGIRRTLTIHAPHDGTVVYRDPSPRAAQQQQPIFVLAEEPGFRLQTQLASNQLPALEDAGEVTLKLVDRTVEPYFGGRLLSARAMSYKPGYVVAELSCNPPREAIRELMEGEEIAAKLQWKPPLTTSLLFRIGTTLALAGLTGWLLGTLAWSWRKPTRQEPAGQNGHEHRPHATASRTTERRRMQLPNGAEMPELESGSVSALHELLGERLREVILRDDIDSDVLSAIEWALDRHHTRAVRQLRVGLKRDEMLDEKVNQLQFEYESAVNTHETGFSGQDDRERVLRVLRTIDSQLANLHTPPCSAQT